MSKAEKFVSDCTRNCSNYQYSNNQTLTPTPTPWLTPDQARKAVEIARKEIYKWLDNNLALYDACNCFIEKCRLLKDLKKAMKDD